MKSRSLPFATLLSLLWIGTPSLAQSTTESRIAALEETVRALQSKVAALEAKLAEQRSPVEIEPRRSVIITRGTLIYRPDSAEFYPEASKQKRERGTVKVKICYGTNGRVVESSVDESSGIPRLDEAAVRMAREYRYKPGTEDGRVVAGCIVEPISFSPAQP